MKVFASQLRSMPEFGAVMKALTNIRLLMFTLTAWVMGIGIGLIFTFLFWHLQDYGGHPTIFGIASVINHISEMGAYFYSFKIISQYGHVKVLMVGLLGNVIRFIYISFITWPWLVLPFEFLQGDHDSHIINHVHSRVQESPTLQSGLPAAASSLTTLMLSSDPPCRASSR